MDFSSDIHALSVDQLIQLKQQIKTLINEKSQISHIEKIKEAVALRGFHCDTKFNDPIEGLEFLELPLYVDIYTYDRSDQEEWKVEDLSQKQLSWVNALCFEYEPTDDDNLEDMGEWETDDDWDDPLSGKASMPICLS